MSTVINLDCALTWHSVDAQHQERVFLSLEQEMLPAKIKAMVAQLQVGESVQQIFAAGELLADTDPQALKQIQAQQFSPPAQLNLSPQLGRFYPKSFAAAALGTHRRDYSPCRLIAMDKLWSFDCNHPLAGKALTLTFKRITLDQPLKSDKGFVEQLLENGPGMQAAYPQINTGFYAQYPFCCQQEDDAAFYQNPRMVAHLDQVARAQIESIYSRHLDQGMNVLDLMSSCMSHLPQNIDCEVVGLGMNAEELSANPRLSSYQVQDLNQNPRLPFADNHFDLLLCSASIEYLRDPIAVFKELARVAKPQARFITTFSDRWFSGKEIRIWSEMHPFERLGMVLDFYRQSDCFQPLETETVRGLARPLDDKYIKQRPHADPVFMISGSVKAP